MDSVLKNFNQLAHADQLKLLKGPYGKELLKIIAKSTAVFEWGNIATDALPHHGSVFFIRPGDIPLAVTARHVYEGYARHVAEDSAVRCQINGLRFNPTQRLVGFGRDCPPQRRRRLEHHTSTLDCIRRWLSSIASASETSLW
jgi:hypothetical protein